VTALRIGDEPLAPATVAAAARARGLIVELTPAARERMALAHRTAEETARDYDIYGFTTGVGANRDVEVAGDLQAHTLRLLRSHAAGLGDPLPEEVVRATLLVRLAQLSAGAGANRPAVADALAAVLCEGPLPRLRSLGGIGTGDLTVLAQLALALAGEADPRDPAELPHRLDIEAGDALPFMSSNAATFATAVLAWRDLADLLDAGFGVAALTFDALRGNRQAFDAAVATARPLPGLTAAGARMRALDPFGLRCVPPVAGALDDALSGLERVLAIEINAGSENPLFVGGRALHHGGFHAATCALALDAVRLALVPFASLSAARLTHLMAPELSGLTPFLAVEESGASGVMIAEYLAADALARLRAEAVPAVIGSASISRGLEEHASFAWQAAWQARRAATHVRTVIALEWVVAERALRMRGAPADGVLAGARALAQGFEARLEDRPIGEDVARAAALLEALAGVVRAAL
jgi:histidine ammonia-lyase